jgi:hypothetical protein
MQHWKEKWKLLGKKKQNSGHDGKKAIFYLLSF